MPFCTEIQARTLRPVWVIWILLSIVVAALSTVCFLEPSWIINRRTHVSLGVFSYCSRDMTTKGGFVPRCQAYGGRFQLSKLPSNAWQAACVMCGGGALLLCVGAALGVITICVPKAWDRRLSAITGYIQATAVLVLVTVCFSLAVLVLVTGMVVYPLGLDTKFVRYYCPGSGVYQDGDCQLGWAYLLDIVTVALAAFTPFLSHYTDLDLRKASPRPPERDYRLKSLGKTHHYENPN